MECHFPEKGGALCNQLPSNGRTKKKTKPLAFMLFMFCCFFYAPYVLPMKSPRLGLLVLLLL